MKKNGKVIVAIAALIGIGFLGGFYTHRYLSTQKIERIARMRSAEGFREGIFTVVDASEEQRQQLAPIIDRYSKAMGRSHREWRRSLHALVDSMHQEIYPYLDEAQRDELNTFNRRYGNDRDREGDRRK